MGSVFRAVKGTATAPLNPSRALKGASENLASVTSSLTGGFAQQGAAMEDQATEAAAGLEAEATEDRRRRLLAEQSRTQTSPTGAGRPRTGRATVTGV